MVIKAHDRTLLVQDGGHIDFKGVKKDFLFQNG